MSSLSAGRLLNHDDIEEALDALVALDPRLVPVRATAGPLPLRHLPAGFAGLAFVIVSQMVSRAAATAIWRRMEADDATDADRLAQSSTEDHRAWGLSRAKAASLTTAATACLDGCLDLEALAAAPAEEAFAALTALRGIGPWTAEVYLLLGLGHADIFPAGDVALQAAAQHALGLESRPKGADFVELAKAWAPRRSVAARLLWAHYARIVKTPLNAIPTP
ncbi:hypothetical protein BJF93_01470 [Xaviernesmea oryzae]|uniref:DNA-3-methyladenine glycosylase II n=1 Tax=Xaviernesmea oryzae TaxID=464029 RepID=A0A1Q9B2E4_9HYPH|nr:DNA-3-methyladenine glycosylase [Xaviernesmea oryzae]OLP62142.1 hypothetical protein BJF93_01470 [Xaviernesmea oryzae]SEL88919.1 DNA-3-methyladenine glycosylase II [Xaviernesmea oryzae]